MEDSKNRFSDRVENYVRYRPAYPEKLIDALVEFVELNKSSHITDIGSGTGLLTRHLLDRKLLVTAVEPNEEMRSAAESLLAKYPQFTSRSGSAEATGLESDTFDLVTVAQAFHWFDWPESIKEFKRVLKPGGRLALIWNRRDLKNPFQQAYDKMLREHAPEYNRVNHMNIEDEKITAIFEANNCQHLTFPYTQFFNCAAFLGRMQSSSYSPPEGSDTLLRLIEAAIALFEEYSVDGELAFEYSSHLYLGRLRA